MKKTIISAAIAGVFGFAATGAQAFTLNTGDILTITDGAQITASSVVTAVSGSFFGMDTDGNSKIALPEATPIDGLAGITIGSTVGSYVIDQWAFFSNTGSHYLTSPVSGDTTNGLNMSGWTVDWAAVPLIPMGTGAWAPLNCGAAHMGCTGQTFTNGVANFSWDGIYGNAYTLWYSATVPDGDPSGFGNVQYFVKLTGVVQEGTAVVPVPAAAWLLGSGLLGLVGVARRKAAKA
jgi:hypothetical protein